LAATPQEGAAATPEEGEAAANISNSDNASDPPDALLWCCPPDAAATGDLVNRSTSRLAALAPFGREPTEVSGIDILKSQRFRHVLQ